MRKLFLASGLIASLAFLFISCSLFGGAKSCPVTGPANQSAFDQNFTQVSVIKEGSQVPGTGSENDLTFTSSDKLELAVVAKDNTEAQICIEPLQNGLRVPYNKKAQLTAGVNLTNLGSFVVSQYVVHISVNKVPVKNITFTVK